MRPILHACCCSSGWEGSCSIAAAIQQVSRPCSGKRCCFAAKVDGVLLCLFVCSTTTGKLLCVPTLSPHTFLGAFAAPGQRGSSAFCAVVWGFQVAPPFHYSHGSWQIDIRAEYKFLSSLCWVWHLLEGAEQLPTCSTQVEQ